MKQTLILTSLLALWPSLILAQVNALPLSKSYWSSAEFVKSFNGSYRTNARIEPYITGEEKEVLQTLQKNMASGKRGSAVSGLLASPLLDRSAALQYNLGNVYFELGELENARSSYAKAIKRYPSFRRAYKNLGIVLMRLDQKGGAMENLLKALELGDMSASTLGILAYCHLENKNVSSALQAYKLAQLSEPNHIAWKAGAAQCLVELNRLTEGLAMIEEVYKQRPQEDSYALLYVHTLIQAQQVDKAIALLELMLRQGRLGLSQRSMLGQLYAVSGDFRLARPHIDFVVASYVEEKETNDWGAVLSALQSAVALGEWQYAFNICEMLDGPTKEKFSQKELSKFQRFKAYSMAHLGMQEALPLIEALLREAPLDGELILLAAKRYHEMGDFAAAAVFYQRAEQIDEFKYRAFLAHGAMLVEQKRYSRALEKYLAAQEIQETEDQLQYIEQLRKVVGSL